MPFWESKTSKLKKKVLNFFNGFLVFVGHFSSKNVVLSCVSKLLVLSNMTQL